MTTSDPVGTHDWHSQQYVQEWIASQRDDNRVALLHRMIDLIPLDPDGEIRVLDIGGGYGAVTKVLLESFPRARVVLQDFSEPMLDEARQRLSNYSDSVSFVQSDLMTPAWSVELGGEFDAVVSSRAIHNVRFPDRIRAIYAEVFAKVAPGGCFLNFDEVVAAGPLVAKAEQHAQLMSRRRHLYEQSRQLHPLDSPELTGSSRRRMETHSHASEEDERRIAEQEPNTVANQLHWLVEAGFKEADCPWRDGNRAILAAFRAP